MIFRVSSYHDFLRNGSSSPRSTIDEFEKVEKGVEMIMRLCSDKFEICTTAGSDGVTLKSAEFAESSGKIESNKNRSLIEETPPATTSDLNGSATFNAHTQRRLSYGSPLLISPQVFNYCSF